MPDFAQAWIPYRTMRRSAGAHWRDSEVMAEHEISLALPSLRWGLPAYAFFASPRAAEGEGVVQYPPACWWVLTASGGMLANTVVRTLRGSRWMSAAMRPSTSLSPRFGRWIAGVGARFPGEPAGRPPTGS